MGALTNFSFLCKRTSRRFPVSSRSRLIFPEISSQLFSVFGKFVKYIFRSSTCTCIYIYTLFRYCYSRLSLSFVNFAFRRATVRIKSSIFIFTAKGLVGFEGRRKGRLLIIETEWTMIFHYFRLFIYLQKFLSLSFFFFPRSFYLKKKISSSKI